MYFSMLKSGVGFRSLEKCKLVLSAFNTSNNAGPADVDFFLQEMNTLPKKMQPNKTI
jgi:hypothetical protein